LRGILRLSVEIIGRRPASLRRRPAPFNIRYPIATQHITHLVAGIANSTQIVIL
jgi:predicted aldo/keto reductase-like oxidoreductase